jgi:hypothetical protein
MTPNLTNRCENDERPFGPVEKQSVIGRRAKERSWPRTDRYISSVVIFLGIMPGGPAKIENNESEDNIG